MNAVADVQEQLDLEAAARPQRRASNADFATNFPPPAISESAREKMLEQIDAICDSRPVYVRDGAACIAVDVPEFLRHVDSFYILDIRSALSQLARAFAGHFGRAEPAALARFSCICSEMVGDFEDKLARWFVEDVRKATKLNLGEVGNAGARDLRSGTVDVELAKTHRKLLRPVVDVAHKSSPSKKRDRQ